MKNSSVNIGRSRMISPHGRIAVVALLLVTMVMLAACASTAQSPDSGKAPGAVDGRRSSHSSGIAYRDGSVPLIINLPPRVNLAGDPRLGRSEALIGIVEFSDYQCPYCSGFHQEIFPKLRKEYLDTGVVQFIHKDLPLSQIHPQALPAALAANCAGKQRHYWEMHDALYLNRGQLGPALYSDLARKFKLDEHQFSSCLTDPDSMKQIQRDVDEAQRLGVNATPSFVIGRIEGNVLTVVRMARGAPSFEAFVQEIENLRHQINTDATPKTK
jgi:protein-disulfide isomerase